MTDLEELESVGKRNTGTIVKFKPDPIFFDSAKFSVRKLTQTLRSKAVLCSGLEVSFYDENDNSSETWIYQDGLKDYLSISLEGYDCVPSVPLVINHHSNEQELACTLTWTENTSNIVHESFVNLIPTSLGGTHVNGLRSGLTDALKEFCEFRSLLPKNIKLTQMMFGIEFLMCFLSKC